MRTGAVLLFKAGYCYQSFHWQRLRPLGALAWSVEMLDRYGVDEISLIRPLRGSESRDEWLADLKALACVHCMTPLSFGGGIRHLSQLDDLAELPIERLIFSSAFVEPDQALIAGANRRWGRQAIQALLPIRQKSGEMEVYHCGQKTWRLLSELNWQFIDDFANEVILYDTAHEGEVVTDRQILCHDWPVGAEKCILAGGIGPERARLVQQQGYAAALVENRMLHHEYAMPGYRHG